MSAPNKSPKNPHLSTTGAPPATTNAVASGDQPTIEQLLKRIDALEQKLTPLEAENTHLKAELARKDKIIAGLQQRIFGSSSEKLDPAQLQLLFDEIIMGKPAPPPEHGGETFAPEEPKTKLPKSRRTKADRFPKNLKILIENVITPQEVLDAPDDWKLIGAEHSDELDITKAEIFWRRTVREKYVHKTQKTLPPIIAPAPQASIPGTLLAPALAAQIICDKYQDHLPHHRQAQRLRRRHDIDIGRQTLNSWTHATARHLAPIDRAIRAEILQAEQLQVDETPISYLQPGHGTTREGRLWAYRDVARATCYFDWHAGRGADCLLDFLGYDKETNTIAYQGIIHTDGYTVYDTVAAKHGLRHAGCLAHTRRKFTDLGKAAPEVTIPILLYIQRIYQIEKQLRQTAAPAPCRELIRRTRSRPIAQELHRFVSEAQQRHLPGSDVAQAINYTLNQWHKIILCFEDGVLELDTNLVENMIRPTKLGMKNWMFFGSVEAGTNNALIYTLLANCKAQELDPEDYLIEVLKRLPHNATIEQAAALTPRNIAAERKAKAALEATQVA
jgi:transposase